MAINVVSPKAELEKLGALPSGSHMLQWVSPVFLHVSIEVDSFLLCPSLEKLKKSVFLEKGNLLLRSRAEVIRAAACWTPGTCPGPCVYSCVILPGPCGAGAPGSSILQLSH